MARIGDRLILSNLCSDSQDAPHKGVYKSYLKATAYCPYHDWAVDGSTACKGLNSQASIMTAYSEATESIKPKALVG